MVTTRRSAAAEKNGVRLRAAATQRRQQRQSRGRGNDDTALPEPLRQLLVEAGVAERPSVLRLGGDARLAEVASPPAKRLKRPGEKAPVRPSALTAGEDNEEKRNDDNEEDGNDDDVFEDVPIPIIQTLDRGSDDDDDDDDEDDDELVFQDVDLARADVAAAAAAAAPQPLQTLELNLSAHSQISGGSNGSSGRPKPARKRPLTQAERALRVDVHKVHVLCLLAHAARRNRWCNGPAVQAALRPLLTEQMRRYLVPSERLSQFGRAESLKNGLQQVMAAFRARFVVTERGLRRALWAEDAQQLAEYHPPPDIESTLDKDDFLRAAQTLQGSRDVGAQLFCALLRTAGVPTRLVCSLQPLAFLTSAPTMPRPQAPARAPKKKPPALIPPIYQPTAPPPAPDTSAASASPLRRLGHPLAAAYRIPPSSSPGPSTPSPQAAPAAPAIRGESPFPVYWVEVLDVAHQKWQPVDPLVTGTLWRPGKLEPPAADRLNQMSYVVGLAADGAAKDVTRRYAKAYTAKTRRTRVDGMVGGRGEGAASFSFLAASAQAAAAAAPETKPLSGSQWLRRVLRHYTGASADGLDDTADQIEDAELAAREAHEPMPRNVADFQHHPTYALARHLRRHEVLAPQATAVGTVAAGSRAPLERIYRRRDVRVAYSADRWYRLGRLVRPDEIPAKWLPRARGRDDDDDDNDNEDQGPDHLFADGHPPPNGVPLYTPEQTDPYRAPPVVHGRVPKNKFGNVDVYVPSMVPPGGVHILDDTGQGLGADDGRARIAARAAFILGVDYAPALVGFRFDGGGGRGVADMDRRWAPRRRRHGTAVLNGVVVAAEYEEAVRAVMAGLCDAEAEAEAERRTLRALRAWSAFLRGLRIRERIRVAAADRGEDVDEDESVEDHAEDEDDAEKDTGVISGRPSEREKTSMDDTPLEMEPYDDDDDFYGGGFIPD